MTTCPADARASDQVVVASVPAGHAYVRHLAAPAGGPGHPDPVLRLPDPHPERPGEVAHGRWWPPAMLEPAWVSEHDFDLMHLHFGLDERTPAQLGALVGTLRRLGRPLVLTVHDLRSPHQVDRTLLDAQLDVLVPAADALLTLTAGAADEVASRWGRRPEVVPHPHVVDLEVARRVRAARRVRGPGAPRVGVAVKDLRPNTDPQGLLPALVALAAQGVRPVVTVHRGTWERPRDARAARLVDTLAAVGADGTVEVVVHDPLDDADLWAHVAGLDVAVLPYRFGTHSGWLEMCHDLGTSVVAPALGHYADQGVEGSFEVDEQGPVTASVVAAVLGALAAREHGLPGAGPDDRLRQRREVAAAHERVYRELLARPASGAAHRSGGAA